MLLVYAGITKIYLYVIPQKVANFLRQSITYVLYIRNITIIKQNSTARIVKILIYYNSNNKNNNINNDNTYNNQDINL